MTTLMGLFRPGDSVVHRLPASVKLVVLVVAGVASVFVDAPATAVAALALIAVCYSLSGVGARSLWVGVKSLMWVALPLLAFQAFAVGWERAVVIVGVIAALVLLANLVTLTTRTSELVDVVVGVAGRLTRLGVRPERVGLMLNLTIRAVPLVADLANKVREAQLARGQTLSARAFAVPLVVGALRRADQIGEALAARGLDD